MHNRLFQPKIITPTSKINNENNPYDSEIMSPLYTRPFSLYEEIIKQIQTSDSNAIDSKLFTKALDIGCGTGISSKALSSIAKTVIGIDPSANMLKQADKTNKNITYQVGMAESLPFDDNTFDLITFSVSFHWVIDPQKALEEAARVLKDNGKLVIYYTRFTGVETQQYFEWEKNVFFKKYPVVRVERKLSAEKLKSIEFPEVKETNYPYNTQVTKDELADLLMTMSGVFNNVQKNNENPADIKTWLLHELEPLFSASEKLPFRWDISIRSLQRQPRLVLQDNVYNEIKERSACKM